MMGYSTVTQKGQITIPISIRQDLGLQPNQRVLIVLDDRAAKVVVAPDIRSLRGSIKTRKRFNLHAMRKSAQRLVASRHAINP